MEKEDIWRHLYPYQQAAINGVFDQISTDRSQGKVPRIMLQLPTGAGKTVIAAAIIKLALLQGKRVIFSVPALVLIGQSLERFVENEIPDCDIGVIQGFHHRTNPACPVQIASIQTLARRPLRNIPHADLVIVDEAHNDFKFFDKWMDGWSNVTYIGLSATPWTKGLGNRYSTLLQPVTMTELIDAGRLSKFRVYAKSHPELSGVKTRKGDYIESELEDVMRPLTADIVQTYKKDGEGRPALCFATTCAHAQELQADFCAHGVPAAYMDAYTEADDRQQIFDDFTAGKYQVICNVGVLTTGLDLDVRCIILARPTRSDILYVQMIGRGLRTAEGKDDCLILDHSDTTLKLGFVTDIHHDELDRGKRNESGSHQKEPPKPTECSSCQYLKPAGIHTCPECGFEPEQQSNIEVAPGELVEIKRSKSQTKINQEWSREEKQQFHAELLRCAIDRNLKPGWVYHKYLDRCGVAPPNNNLQPAEKVSRETSNWIKSRNIAYAKRKRA